MLIKNLLKDIYFEELPDPLAQMDIQSICVDSRKVEANALFIALSGVNLNGADFIHEAKIKGATVIVQDKKFLKNQKEDWLLTVPDTKEFLKKTLIRFYGDLSKKIRVIGITGTNGKTTTAYLIESILKVSDKSSGIIGTVNYRYLNQILPAPNTTPGLVEICTFLNELIQKNVEYCVMEVSSHALDQGRVELIDFRTAVFTNLTSDHLDYHKNREEYFNAKAKLFTNLQPKATAIINIDDPYGRRLVQQVKAKVLTYGIAQAADMLAKDIDLNLSGTSFQLQYLKDRALVKTSFIGMHNVYNMLAAAAVCLNEGFSLAEIRKGIEQLRLVPGRLEAVNVGQNFSIFVDYAHTEDALKNVLNSIRNVTDAKIILVFGCGGDRDKSKRPKMGETASLLADTVILTNDNPRSENPESIVQDILKGFKKENYTVILDRQKAIEEALRLANTENVVLVAGKGHEDYQIFKDKKMHFDDRQVLREILSSRKK